MHRDGAICGSEYHGCRSAKEEGTDLDADPGRRLLVHLLEVILNSGRVARQLCIAPGHQRLQYLHALHGLCAAQYALQRLLTLQVHI